MTASTKPRAGARLRQTVNRTSQFLERGQWEVDVGGLPTMQRAGLRVVRVLTIAWQGLSRNDCFTRASALTYITVLSLVPMLAFAFSMAKGFGAYERLVDTAITPFLDQLAPPVDTQTPPGGAVGAQEIRGVTENLLELVGNTSFANLGLLGLGALVLATLQLMTNIERVFNTIWGVRRARRLVRKITDFVALLVVTPILLLVATTVTVSLQSNAVTEFLSTSLGLGVVVGLVSRLVPLVMVWLGFAFLYVIMPNTRVAFSSALVGGLVGGTLWQIVQVLHVQFQIGVANYNAIYAGFAALPLFLVWVYMNWVAVLLGALVAWAHQTQPTHREVQRSIRLTAADREALALRALVSVATAFVRHQGPIDEAELGARCGAPPSALDDVMGPLVSAHLVARSEGPEPGFLPARPIADIRLHDVLRALRGERRAEGGADRASDSLARLDRAVDSSPENLSLVDLVESEPS